MKKAWKLVLLAAVVVVVGVACSGPNEREGQHDLRPENSKAEEYVGRLVHSRDEYDRGVEHLTAWWVVRGPEGKITRRWIPSVEVWDCLVKAARDPKPVQLSEAWMDKEMPIQTGNPMTCSDAPPTTQMSR